MDNEKVLFARVLGAIMDRVGYPPDPHLFIEYFDLRNELRRLYDPIVAEQYDTVKKELQGDTQ